MNAIFSLSKSGTSLALNFSEIVLLVFGAILVFGLVGEYHEAWKKHLKLFEILVIVGVAGELLADGGIFLFSKHLQTLGDLEISSSYQRAAEANAVAQSARAAAETAAKDELQLQKDNLRLEAQLQHGETENAKAQTRIRVLEQENAPRTISPEQQQKVLSLLKAFSGQRAVVEIVALDEETQEFGNQVIGTLSKAGLVVNVTHMMGTTGRGFEVVVHDPTSAPPLASAIVMAFRSVGLSVTASVSEQYAQTGSFTVFIGAHPVVQEDSRKRTRN